MDALDPSLPHNLPHKKYSGLKTQTLVWQSVVLFLANLLFLFFHRHLPVASKSFEYFWDAHTCQRKFYRQTSEDLHLHHILTEVFHESNLYKLFMFYYVFYFFRCRNSQWFFFVFANLKFK